MIPLPISMPTLKGLWSLRLTLVLTTCNERIDVTVNVKSIDLVANYVADTLLI